MANFKIVINTPAEKLTFREGATITLTGNILKDGKLFRPDLPGEVDRVNVPYSMVFGLRDERGMPLAPYVELRAVHVFNTITGMVHYYFDVPRLSDTGAQKVSLVAFLKLLVDGSFRTFAAEQKLFVQDATTNDRAPVSPAAPATGDFGMKIVLPQPLATGQPAAPNVPIFVSGRTSIMDDRAWMYVVLYDKTTGVTSDTFLAQNWTRSNLKRFSGQLIAPPLPQSSVHTLEAQVRLKDGGAVLDSTSIDIEIKKPLG